MSVANGKRSEGNHAREHSPPLTSSPIGYTLRHTEGHLLAQDSQRSVASESFTVLPDRVGDDVIDIRIFFPDGRAVEFTVEGGVEALAEDLLQLMAEHLGINNDFASEALALWLVSPLLGKTKRISITNLIVHSRSSTKTSPHRIRGARQVVCFPAALHDRNRSADSARRAASDDSSQRATDHSPRTGGTSSLLCLYTTACFQLESEAELANVLYLDAREALLTSRYLVDKETAITLAALQLAIDFGSFTTKDEALDLIHDNLSAIIPEQHLSAVRSFRLFGLQMMECKKGLENELANEYEDVSARYPTVHQRRCAYLDILRKTPFYGATFFMGTTDRRSTVSLKQLGRRLFSSTSPQMEVRVGINQDYITISDPQRHEPLLLQHITDCTWQRSDNAQADDGEIPSFYLHFPDETTLPAGYRNRTSSSPLPENHSAKPTTSEKRSSQPENHMPVTRLLQVSSKQAVMMEALLNALYEISVSENGSVEDLAEQALSLSSEGAAVSPLHGENSDEKDAILPACSPHEAPGSDHSHASSQSNTTGSATLHANGRTLVAKSPSIGSGGRSPGSDDGRMQFPNKLQRLCFATFDPSGRCVEAHGTLRRVLMECR
ncbi:FERM central domain containing protein [Aphelenchoides avenae]|nr:FERM central domain containing protein [Aphelenchus avenae]